MSDEAIQIAKDWMTKLVKTVMERKYDDHMDLISKRVHVSGIRGFDSINYDSWARQCKHEFEDNIIRGVSYEGLKMLSYNDNQIMFKTYESAESTDGFIQAQGIEVLLENEDGNWRVVQERVLSAEEVKHDKLFEKRII